MSRRTKFANQSSTVLARTVTWRIRAELAAHGSPQAAARLGPIRRLAHLLGMTQQICGAQGFKPLTFGRASPGRDGAAEVTR